MPAISREPLRLNLLEAALLGEVLEGERRRVVAAIRHTAERSPREELRRRLETVERLMERCHAAVSAE